MSTDDDPSSAGSMAAQHTVAPRAPLKVAPTDGSAKFNAIRIPLIPVACWRLNDPAFAFDSSFVAPAFHDELATLAGIIAANQDCPAALFGHCDPAGSDALNKTLGDRRVIAVYALLTRQPALWGDIYDNPAVGDTWGTAAIQTILGTLTDGDGNPYYAGAVDAQYGPGTTDAVKRFQGDSGLSADGQAGSDTRKVLFGAYMDWLCTPASSDPSTPATPFRMQPTDFLGGVGAQAGDLPKMSLQSCGKLNPIVLLTSADMNGPDQGTRNAEDAPNRRVLMFLFEKGVVVDTAAWPCPKVKDTGDACKTALWPEGDTRRKNGDTLRLYRETRDTMACRFYDRFARRSPCEGASAATIVSIRLLDDLYQPCATIPFTLYLPSGAPRHGTTQDDGWLHVPVPPDVTQVDVEYAAKPMATHRTTVMLHSGRTDASYLSQIGNLGFVDAGPDDPSRIVAFQTASAKLDVTGQLDGPTKSALDTMLTQAVAPYFEETDV